MPGPGRTVTSNAVPWWLEPYATAHVLAGFITAAELRRLCPGSVAWPPDARERVRAIHGAADRLSVRPEAGSGRVGPVEEPEVLKALDPVARTLQLGPGAPISHEWVEISNLISLRAVAIMPSAGQLSLEDAAAVADFSLFGPQPLVQLQGNGSVVSNRPLEVGLVGLSAEDGKISTHYHVKRPYQPIIVAYEGGRLFLFSAYGLVLLALALGSQRLLCLVHYGLDFAAPNIGVRIALQGAKPAIHLRPELLSGGAPPLVRDFLDPELSTTAPIRRSLYVTQFGAHSTELGTALPGETNPTEESPAEAEHQV